MNSADHLIIIGNGITGITCALETRKRSECRITVISNETNFFFSRPALMYVFMKQMTPSEVKPYEDKFWKKKRIELLRAEVREIHPGKKKLALGSGESLSYTKLVLATGSNYNKFGWPGQDLQGVQGFYSWQDLELLERNAAHAKHAVIVGGGLIGVEVAEMLISRGIEVNFVIREKHFWGNILPEPEAILVENHIRSHNVKLHFEKELQLIEGDSSGHVKQIMLTDGTTLPADLVALTVGVSPNIALAKSADLNTKRGILVTRGFETSERDIFAAGDCAEFHEPPVGRRAVEQVWYTGKAQAEALARNLTGDNAEYAPGTWFNSAKFFELEYQVYGDVKPQNEHSYYWQDSKGMKCIRLVWSEPSMALIGIHAIGLRLRQKVCVAWIEKRLPVMQVIEELGQANFDPEFFLHFEREILESFRRRRAS